MKNLMNLGKTLNKNEQKEIFGGRKLFAECVNNSDCDDGGDDGTYCCLDDMCWVSQPIGSDFNICNN